MSSEDNLSPGKKDQKRKKNSIKEWWCMNQIYDLLIVFVMIFIIIIL